MSVNINLQQFLETHPSLVPVPEAQEYLSRLSLSGPRSASSLAITRPTSPRSYEEDALGCTSSGNGCKILHIEPQAKIPANSIGRTSSTRSPRSRPSGGPNSDSAKKNTSSPAEDKSHVCRVAALITHLAVYDPGWLGDHNIVHKLPMAGRAKKRAGPRVSLSPIVALSGLSRARWPQPTSRPSTTTRSSSPASQTLGPRVSATFARRPSAR